MPTQSQTRSAFKPLTFAQKPGTLTIPRTPQFATDKRVNEKPRAMTEVKPDTKYSPFVDSMASKANSVFKKTPDRLKRSKQPTQNEPRPRTLTRPREFNFHTSKKPQPVPKEAAPAPAPAPTKFKHLSPNRKIYSPSYAGEGGISVSIKRNKTKANTPVFGARTQASLARVNREPAPKPVEEQKPVRRNTAPRKLTIPISPQFAATQRPAKTPSKTMKIVEREIPVENAPARNNEPRGLTRPKEFRFQSEERSRPEKRQEEKPIEPRALFKARPILHVEQPALPNVAPRPLTRPSGPRFRS
jgi:hypothetical protein